MTKLKEILPGRSKDGDIGLEFEVETEYEVPEVNTGIWETHDDPSLRGTYNYEFVTKKPLDFDNVGKAIKYIIGKADRPEYKPRKDSETTSWHVHINAGNYTLTEMVTATMFYWLVEPIIIRMTGNHRISNPFCTQLYSCKNAIKIYDEDFFLRITSKYPNDAFGADQMQEFYRYCAQNMAALAKFGSVEYRAMEGTYDPDRVIAWINTLKAIWSSPFKNPDEVLDLYYEKGITVMMERYLPLEAHQIVTNDLLEMVDSNALLIASTLEQVPMSWVKLEERITANKAKPKAPVVKVNAFEPAAFLNGAQPGWMVVDEVQPAQVNFQFNGANWVVMDEAAPVPPQAWGEINNQQWQAGRG